MSYLERVADLAADVREGDVQTGHDDGLQFTGCYDVWIDGVARQQVHEDDVGRPDERRVLPGVVEERPVDAPQPRRHLAAVEVTQTPTATS